MATGVSRRRRRLKLGYKIPTAVIPAFDDEVRKAASSPEILLASDIQQSYEIRLILGPRWRPRKQLEYDEMRDTRHRQRHTGQYLQQLRILRELRLNTR